MITSGSSDQCIVNHDIRVKDSAINLIGAHNGQINNLRFHNNTLIATSYEDSIMAIWDDYLTKPHSEQVKLEFPIKSLDLY